MSKPKMVHMPVNVHDKYKYCKRLIESSSNLSEDHRKDLDIFIHFYESNNGNIYFDINDGYFKVKELTE